MNRLKNKIKLWYQNFSVYVDRAWYGPSIGFLALIDNIILVIPNDGILISSVMMRPKKWWQFCVFVTIGSALGAWVLTVIIQNYGMDFVHFFSPDIEQSLVWKWTANFFDLWGLYLLFLVALTPVAQQPAVILATLAHIPVAKILFVILVGRFLKYLLMSYLASHAPAMISRLWGVQSELEEVGIKAKDTLR